MSGHDWGERLKLVDLDEVLEGTRSEEECLSLLQRHGGGELRLLIIVSQVSYLVEGTVWDGIEGGGGRCW